MLVKFKQLVIAIGPVETETTDLVVERGNDPIKAAPGVEITVHEESDGEVRINGPMVPESEVQAEG